MNYYSTLSFARSMDEADSLRHYRDKFYFPKSGQQEALYLCGNSLGLQPKAAENAILKELHQWRSMAIEGFFHGPQPWLSYHKYLQAGSASIVGAKEHEVVVMNTLTVNLHLLLVSFYQPSVKRFKIIMEAGAFPSDQYAVESQVRWHGFDPMEAIVEVAPREGEFLLRTDDIIHAIAETGDKLALVLFGGINYYTGQYYDLKAIAEAGHKAGAKVGFDLAHAAGNVPMELHDWQLDFACWCSYKYLNSGPGGPGTIFVHEKHGDNPGLNRFAGWWGHHEEERFLMGKGFKPMKGAAGWQLSTPQILSFAAHKASLELFSEVGIKALREKSIQLTGYLEFFIEALNQKGHDFKIITPKNPGERGCQLSVLTAEDGKALFDYLSKAGVMADWREPNVIRFAPVPLYNSFEDVWKLAQLLESFHCSN